MNRLTNIGTRKGRRKGFSLIELLGVITVAAILATLSAPALSSLLSSGQVNQTALELSGLLEQARQYAISQNTYVWVAFYPSTNATTGISELSVAVLASTDGTDPSPWASYGVVPNANIELVNKITTYRQVQLSDAGTFSSSNVKSLPATPVAGTANSLSNNTATFSIKIPATSNPTSFARVIQFTPAGEARNSSSPINLVEFGLEPEKGNSTAGNQNNVAVFRVNGLTGQTFIYRN